MLIIWYGIFISLDYILVYIYIYIYILVKTRQYPLTVLEKGVRRKRHMIGRRINKFEQEIWTRYKRDSNKKGTDRKGLPTTLNEKFEEICMKRYHDRKDGSRNLINKLEQEMWSRNLSTTPVGRNKGSAAQGTTISRSDLHHNKNNTNQNHNQ